MRRHVTTPRLTLRPWRAGDGPALRAALDASDAHLRPWVPFMRSEPRTLEQTCEQVVAMADQFEAGERFRWAVLSADEALVGEVLLMPKADAPTALGYWLSVDHVGRGYAGEAVAAILKVADDHAMGPLEAFVDLANDGSNRLIQKLGFELDRVQDMDGDTLNVWRR